MAAQGLNGCRFEFVGAGGGPVLLLAILTVCLLNFSLCLSRYFCYLLGLTGGLAAPLVAAGAASIIGGAGAAALGTTAGVAIIGSLFGVAGAGLTGIVILSVNVVIFAGEKFLTNYLIF